MSISVRERADTVATLRFINVHLMEMLAGWIPTTPEMEVKVLFGRHLWDFAQHADGLGKRTAELRLGLHASREPVAEFMAVLKKVASTDDTGRRVDGFYDGVIPIVEQLYAKYLAETDDMMDEPTVRILEHATIDLQRMRRERETLRQDWPDLGADPSWVSALTDAANRLGTYVNFRPRQEPQGVA